MTGRLRRIGVLGGMGPEATVLFMQKMLAAVTAQDDADHIPLLVDSNSQVPSRIAAIVEGTGENPAPVLIDMARRLVVAGAEALAMPCNTAHFYAPQISAASDVPFLNMLELSCDAGFARMGSDGRIGLLGSPALQQTQVFEAPLAARGLRPVYAADQPALLSAIRDIKANGPSEVARTTVNRAADEMAANGAAAICICCTEFSLLSKQIAASVPLYDSLDVLVSACVAFSSNGLADPYAAMPSDVAHRSSATFV